MAIGNKLNNSSEWRTKLRHGQSGWSPRGPEAFRRSLNIPGPLPTTLAHFQRHFKHGANCQGSNQILDGHNECQLCRTSRQFPSQFLQGCAPPVMFVGL